MHGCPLGQHVGQSKNRRYKMPYTVIGGIKHAGLERTPKGICTDRIIGTRKVERPAIQTG